MRLAFVAMGLAVSTMTLPTPSFAQYQHCMPGIGCVPTTQESYNACFQLALARGLNVSMGDRYNLSYFIYECLKGRIPR